MYADLIRAFYVVMLAEWPWNQVRDFWYAHPAPLKAYPGGIDFFRSIWAGEQRGFRNRHVEPAYFWSVVEGLVESLTQRGWDADRFFQLVNHGVQGGPPLSAAALLSLLPPYVEGPMAFADPREWLLHGLAPFLRRLFPGCHAQCGPFSVAGGSHFVLLVFRPNEHPERDFPLADFQVFPGRLLRALPKSFGWPALEILEMLADMRGPGRAAAGTAGMGAVPWNWKGETLRSGRRALGRLMRFQAFCRARGLDVEGRDKWVVVMDKDFPGPSKRWLRGGCAYGAPVFLARIGYPESRGDRAASATDVSLGAVVSSGAVASTAGATSAAHGPAGAFLGMAEKLHREFLAWLVAGLLGIIF